ncbi:spore germination protein [Paenibacillus sp. LHD-117]|uniref:spore germination protein n=1 Tax=Paenibacillus sp. LHD-117 TaxID=3071412 RepID=UPI0027DEF948|nr:spore germination protein [Paenibacillus sp. LHD-117]MDQ6419097.1 spore germination protein [Paenibacillus sp. LHD-117]
MNVNRLITELHRAFGETDDLIQIHLLIRGEKGLLVYLNSMTNSSFVMDYVVKPLSQAADAELPDHGDSLLDSLRKQYLSGLTSQMTDHLNRLSEKLGEGYAAIVLDGDDRVLYVEVKKLDTRQVNEPSTQNVVRGPKEGFTESASTNMSLIRRRIRNDKLRFEKYEIGDQSKTAIYLAFVEGEVGMDVLEQVRSSITSCRMKSLFDSGSLESLFRPPGFTLFPTVNNSERPDSVCDYLLNRRAAVIVNGSPFVLVVPAVLDDFFSSPEDQYQWNVFSAFVRFIRYVSFFFSLCMPALYVAVTSYHQELIPTLLLTSIAAQREGIPFPAVIEIFMMEITFEILREASTRMPRIVGQSIAIAGALVLGEAVVQAGIVSNINVIVVALAVISSYVAPIYTFGSNIRLFRYALIVAGASLGLYGVILGCAFLMVHLSRIEMYGVPYLTSMRRLAGKIPS